MFFTEDLIHYSPKVMHFVIINRNEYSACLR